MMHELTKAPHTKIPLMIQRSSVQVQRGIPDVQYDGAIYMSHEQSNG